MIRVGVIRGGVSPEYEFSLKTGANVLSHLRSDKLNEKYKSVDILIDKEGVWHKNGLPINFEHIADNVDVIWNALHGAYGEDGKVQQVLEHWKIPYTGSGIFPSALTHHKGLAKEQFSKLGIKTPKHILLPVYQEDIDGPFREYSERKAKEIFQMMPPPWIVKPFSGGSSVGIHVCKDSLTLLYALKDVAQTGASTMVEELISGKEASVGVIQNYRNQKLYTLPPTEIFLSKDQTHFDNLMKVEGSAKFISPGRFKKEEKSELMNLASLIHDKLGLGHYSRSDFIIQPKKGIYVLEVDTLPGLSDTSIIPHQLESVGSNMGEFIDHVLELALKK